MFILMPPVGLEDDVDRAIRGIGNGLQNSGNRSQAPDQLQDSPLAYQVGPPQKQPDSGDGFFTTTGKSVLAAEGIAAARNGGSILVRTPGVTALGARIATAAPGVAAWTSGAFSTIGGVPGIGAIIAGFSIGCDVYKLGTMEKQQEETEQEFQQRVSTQRSDTWINVGCTAAGTAIGAAIGFLGFGVGAAPGAMIGAFIGNTIGKSLQSGGLLKGLASGIGKLFSS